jgi:hypothetical protein
LARPGALGVRPAFHPEWVYGKLPPLESLAPRMPTFTLDNADTTALARWLGRADSAPFPYTETKPRALAPDERIQAFELLNRGDAQTRCTSCHYSGDPPIERMKDETQLVAPSLSTVASRRRMEWLAPFLVSHDPAKKPITEKEAELVTSLLYSLPEKSKLPKPGEEARAPVP